MVSEDDVGVAASKNIIPQRRSKLLSLNPYLLPPSIMNKDDTVSISRATSRSSKRGSTMSRSQSLVKRQIQGGNDLKPSDVLIERFVAWKTIVKQLVAYFEVRLKLLPTIYWMY